MAQDLQALAKANAARQCLADVVTRDGLNLGVGSGSTVVPFVAALGDLVRSKGWSNIRCVPTSSQSKALLLAQGLRVTDLEECPRLDVAVDGADELDQSLNCIKGGGGAMWREKLVAYNSETFYVIADFRKGGDAPLGTKWTKDIPLEVSTFGATPLLKYHLPKLGVVHAQLRPGEPNKAGPCVTDNGNLIIDAHFGPISNPAELEAKLKVLPGVIETGLFVAKCSKAYLGMEDGSVKVLKV